MTKPNGRRAGGGRKLTREAAKQTTSVRLSPLVLDYAREHKIKLADTLEDTIRKTKQFRDWLAAH